MSITYTQSMNDIKNILDHAGEVKVAIILFVIVVSILGVIINLFVLFVCTFHNKHKNIDNQLVGFIAFIDLFSAVVTIVLNSILYATNFEPFLSEGRFRALNGVLINASQFSSLLCIGLLSFERFLLITKSIKIKERTWYILIGGCLFSVWGLYGAAAIVKKFRVMPSGAYCQIQLWEDSISMSLYLAISSILLLVLFLMNYFYLKIILYSGKIQLEVEMLTLKANRKKYLGLGDGTTNNNPSKATDDLTKKIVRTKKRCILLVIFYNLFFLPWAITVIFTGIQGDLSIGMDSLNPISYAMTSVFDPILTLSLHEPTKRKSLEIFKSCKIYLFGIATKTTSDSPSNPFQDEYLNV